MKLRVVVCTCALMALAVVFGSASKQQETVELAQLNASNWEQFVPEGKEVDAIYGDVVLRNKHLTAVVAQPKASRHANMTVRDIGGALIDLTTRDAQSDQLSAFYPGKRAYPFRKWSFSVDQKRAEELSGNAAVANETANVTVRAEAGEKRPQVETIYQLGKEDTALTVITRYSNTSDTPLEVSLEDDIRADGGKEDMLKTPNGVSSLYWIHDRYWGQAYGFEAAHGKIEHNSNSNTSVLKYQDKNGNTSITLDPGKSYELTRRVTPAANLVDVKALVGKARGEMLREIQFTVRDGLNRPIPRARVDIAQGNNQIGSAQTDKDGNLTTSLSAGNYQIKFTALGIEIPTTFPLSIIAQQAPQQFDFSLSRFRTGTVEAVITDADGNPIPCKVEYIPLGNTPRPDFGPESADFAVRNLYYAPLGTFRQALPAGHYKVIVSRGPEYDAIFTELAVPHGKTVSLTGRLIQSVQTPGWVSGDFHSHSSPSGDNTGSQLGRVLNLVCEHIEFAPCTEHNRISSYQPHIDRLKIGSFMSTVSGMELTGQPLPLNHQNVFPMKHKPRTQDGGGPVTDDYPETQIERAALWDNRSDKLIQQNHPDIGWLFYDKNGDGEPDSGYERSFALIDVMELHPVENILNMKPFETLRKRKGNSRIFNWLQLLNQGHRIFGVVNTDAHYNYHGSGWLRNWIQSPTDQPDAIKPMDIVHASQQGRVIMSNGPYLEVSLQETGKTETVTAGQELTAKSGKVTLDVRVQCANWLDIDRVFVMVNGRVHATHNYSRQANPDKFRSGVIKFEQTLSLTLDSDAHIVVATGGEKTTLGPVMGPLWEKEQPAAVANPVFVDVDGNGFQPNKDTLGHPLPVKFVAK